MNRFLIPLVMSALLVGPIEAQNDSFKPASGNNTSANPNPHAAAPSGQPTNNPSASPSTTHPTQQTTASGKPPP
jgi:hypothetical protein